MTRIIARARMLLQQRRGHVHQSGIFAKNSFNVRPYPATIFSRLLTVGLRFPSSMSPRYRLVHPDRHSEIAQRPTAILAEVFQQLPDLCVRVHAHNAMRACTLFHRI